MLLAIDAGNTDTVFGLTDEGGAIKIKWRAGTESGRSAEEYAALASFMLGREGMALGDITGCVLSTVASVHASRQLRKLAAEFLPAAAGRFVEAGHEAFDGLMEIRTERPHETGADRLVNAFAAYHRYGQECLAVDIGTAVTVDVIDDSGAFVGGAIMAGPMMSAWGLTKGTAKLPESALRLPKRAVGTNTSEALASGLFYGCLGQVEEMIRRMRVERGKPHAPVIAAGGAGELIAKSSSLINDYDPDLTLTGLFLLYRCRSAR